MLREEVLMRVILSSSIAILVLAGLAGRAAFGATPDHMLCYKASERAPKLRFRVTVNDGQLTATDDVSVTVQSAPALTLLVSKSGEVLKGAITSIKEFSTNSNVKRLELYIDQNETAAIDALSLTYKWDLRKVSGTHVVSGKAYDANDLVVATADVTVSVK